MNIEDGKTSAMFDYAIEQASSKNLTGIVHFVDKTKESLDELDFSTPSFIVFKSAEYGAQRIYPLTAIVMIDIHH